MKEKRHIGEDSHKKTGWLILNNKNKIEITMLIGKISMTIERNKYLGRDKLRISRKVLHEAFDLINNKTQRIRSKSNKKKNVKGD